MIAKLLDMGVYGLIILIALLIVWLSDGGLSTGPTSPPPPANADLPITTVFTTPTGSSDSATYVNGPDTVLAESIREAHHTIDVAAFELNSPAIANALMERHNSGLTIRIVVDDEHGLDISLYEEYRRTGDDSILDEMEEDPEDTLLDELYNAGIPIVDDDRSALMHNKFVIIDAVQLWTGSMNMTVNGSYRNNNNFNRIKSREMVDNYQAEFNEMFERLQFGPSSPSDTPQPSLNVDGVPMEVYFSPEDPVVEHILQEVNAARSNIRFLAFSFTLDEVGQAMLDKGQRGVTVQGVFELTGSETEYAEMTPLFCAGHDVRQDGNPYTMHHKVIIIDDQTTLIGSFNFSANATDSNDENLMIVRNPDVAAQYIAEFERRFQEAAPPDEIDCK